MVTQPDRLALDDEGQALARGPLTGALVVGETLPALLDAASGVEAGERGAGFAERLVQTLAGPAQGGRLFGHDLGLGAAQALAGPLAHWKSTDFTSHCWRWRNWASVSTTRASTALSRLIRSGRMCRTSG